MKSVVEYMNVLFTKESQTGGVMLGVISIKVYSSEISYDHMGGECG